MTPYYEVNGITIHCGDCRTLLASLPEQSVQTCVTSPPYFGLRDYGTAQWEGGSEDCDHTMPSRVDALKAVATSTLVGSKDTQGHLKEPSYRDVCGKCGARRVDSQIGLEETPAAYVAEMVAVFREVRRVLRDDGTVWLNLGDSFGASKQLQMIPARVAIALQDDGWILRADVIWAKPNPMPESVTDRPTRSHEYIFLLAKSATYYYDANAIREPHVSGDDARNRTDYTPLRARNVGGRTDGLTRAAGAMTWPEGGRNKRDVWTVVTAPYADAHFATFSPKLIEPCILAGAPAGGVVLDPFAGAGTTGLVAMKHGRRFIGIELNPDYLEMAKERLSQPSLPLHLQQVEQRHGDGDPAMFGGVTARTECNQIALEMSVLQPSEVANGE